MRGSERTGAHEIPGNSEAGVTETLNPSVAEDDKMGTSTICMVLFLVLCSELTGDPSTHHIPEEHISTTLYGKVTLPCTFSFVQSLQGLSVIWEKEENNRKRIVYWILNGQENLEEQDSRYRGRVKISTEVSWGNLHLILRDVTYEDEGTYYCRAANKYDDGDKKVTLSIEGLDADDPRIILETIDGRRLMKCMSSGVYHHPLVRWMTVAGQDLSNYGKMYVTKQSDGRVLVESLLDYNLEANVPVRCLVMEGWLRRSVEAKMPDDKTSHKRLLPIVFWVILLLLLIYLFIFRHCHLLRRHGYNYFRGRMIL